MVKLELYLLLTSGAQIGEIAATEYNNGVGIDWSDRNFSLYPWWSGSVSEAVFLLGAERNADKVIGTTYVRYKTLYPYHLRSS